jgi:hypothetical protein
MVRCRRITVDATDSGHYFLDDPLTGLGCYSTLHLTRVRDAGRRCAGRTGCRRSPSGPVRWPLSRRQSTFLHQCMRTFALGEPVGGTLRDTGAVAGYQRCR